MKIDSSISDSIKETCSEEGITHATDVIIKFVERYISNELPGNSISGSVQDIYDLIKDNQP